MQRCVHARNNKLMIAPDATGCARTLRKFKIRTSCRTVPIKLAVRERAGWYKINFYYLLYEVTPLTQKTLPPRS